MLSQQTLREYLKTNATITFTAEPEDIPVKGSFASGDEKLDQETENEIYRQLESGNEYAWFCAHVRASWRGFTGDDYLGGCSYKSREDFLKDDYYKSMVDAAIADLAMTIQNAQQGLTELEQQILGNS